MPRHPRVFLGPLEICGYYGALTRGLHEAGAVAHFLHTGIEGSENVFNYCTDQGRHWVINVYIRALGWFRRTRTYSRLDPRRYLVSAFLLVAQALLVAWIALFHDVLVLKSGMGILHSGFDLHLYKLLRRTIIFIYHGSESRPPYINGGYAAYSAEWLNERARWTKGNLQRSAGFATYVADNPLSCHLHDGKILIVQILGNPVDETKLQSAKKSAAARGDAVRILHAPSLAEIKGTSLVRKAIETLKKKGHAIDYVELSGVPNAVVMQTIAESDIVIDELYSDTFGAMLSLEAMMYGRPSLVGGYGLDLLAEVVPEEFAAPTFRVSPDNLTSELERLIENAPLRCEVGKRAKHFADEYATPRSVAERLLQLVAGRAPPEWFFDPRESTYMAGIGADREVIRDMVRRLVAECGVEALQLSDKPEVQARFVQFAAGRTN